MQKLKLPSARTLAVIIRIAGLVVIAAGVWYFLQIITGTRISFSLIPEFLFALIFVFCGLLTIQILRLLAVIIFRPIIRRSKNSSKILARLDWIESFIFWKLSVIWGPWHDDDTLVKKTFRKSLVIWLLSLLVLCLFFIYYRSHQ